MKVLLILYNGKGNYKFIFVDFGCSAQAQQSALDTAASLTRDPAIYALLVARHNNVKYEKYCNGKNANDLFNSQSLTKDVMSLLVGIAINKGYIQSVDEPLSCFFPSLLQDKDKRKQRVTIREVMNQASGLWHEDLESLGGVKASKPITGLNEG